MTLVLTEPDLKSPLTRLQELEEQILSLEALITSQQTRLTQLEAAKTQLETDKTRLATENTELHELLEKQLALLRKFQGMLFGRKSEKGAATPTKAADAAAEAEARAETPVTEAPAPAATPITPTAPPEATASAPSPAPPPAKRPRGQQRGAPGHGRRLYEDLEPRIVVHDLPDDARGCPQCGTAYRPGGSETSSTVEWEVTIRRVEHRRLKYYPTCACQPATIVTAPAPPKLIPKGLLDVSAISHLVVNKFLLGQPINRQLHELDLCSGVRFAPGTLVGVLDVVSTVLRPLYQTFLDHLREAEHWHADETRWMQYGDEARHRWWLWVFASAEVTVFVLDPTRSRAVPLRVFGLDDPAEDARRAMGLLNCDRLKSYQGLPGIWTAFCWAHVRRDFLGVGNGYPCLLGAWADTWVERIGLLYHLTELRKREEPGTEAFRQADALVRDHVWNLARWREEERADQRLLLDARKVLDSLANHWDGLTLFLDHLDVPLDNNLAERLLRTAAVCRKNFYGSGSRTSGELAESAYSVLLTAAQHGFNPLTYLRAYLDACAGQGGNAPEDLTRFLPWKASAADRTAWQRPPPHT